MSEQEAPQPSPEIPAEETAATEAAIPEVPEPVADEVEEPADEQTVAAEVVPDEAVVDEVATDEIAADEPVADELAADELAADEPAADLAAATGEVAPEAVATDDADASATEPVSEPTLDLVDPDRLRRAVEAVLLVVDEPVEVTTLAQTLSVPKPDVLTALTSLRDEYNAGERGLDLREVAGGWRLYSREEFAAYVERFVLDGQQTRLTQAALETLSVIAYRQPVTRSRVSAIRGVGVDGVMRTLTSRGLVEECGTDVETNGGLYRTTSLFLEKLGLNSLDELPPLAPLLPDHTDLDPAMSDD